MQQQLLLPARIFVGNRRWKVATDCSVPRSTAWQYSPQLALSDRVRVANGSFDLRQLRRTLGDAKELDRFKQRYAVEKATIEARRLGRSVLEQQLADGSVKLTISVGAEV